jgi:hypothetical protein
MEDAENYLTELRLKRWTHHINSREGRASFMKEIKMLKWPWS